MDNATNATNTTSATNATNAPRVRGKLAPDRGMRYKSGTNGKGPYEFIGTYIAVGNQLHDVTFQQAKWDEISQSAAPSTEVWLTGVLVDNDEPYTVNAGTDKAYIRKRMLEVELDDFVDSKGSAIAFRRGARLPSFAQLKAAAEEAMAQAEGPVENLA